MLANFEHLGTQNMSVCKYVPPALRPSISICSFRETLFNYLTEGVYISNKKRNAPLKTVQLSGRSQVLGQFSLYQCKGISGTAASHVFCNLA